MNYEALLVVQQEQQLQHRPMFASRHGELLSTSKRELGMATDKVQVHDEGTGGSGSGSPSGFSDLSAMENETDTLGQAILRHEKDARRLQSALRGSQQAFTKARPRQRVASGRLDRGEFDDALAVGWNHQRVGSSGSNDSEPPLNIPRDWGRKAKPQRGWLRKIREPSEGPITANAEDNDDDAIMPRKTSYTGDDYFSPTADDVLPTIEDTPPSMRRKRHISQPTSLHHINSTLRQIMDAEDQDFEDASLLASTPANARRRSRGDELTRREIESLQRQGVTTRTLDQITERSINKSVESRHIHKPLDQEANADAHALAHRPSARPATAPAESHETETDLPGNKENVPLNGHLHSHIRDPASVLITERTVQAVKSKSNQRPVPSREESFNLLRRLARVSSASPSPAKPTDMLNWGEGIDGGDDLPSAREKSVSQDLDRNHFQVRSTDAALKENKANHLPTPSETPEIDIAPAAAQQGLTPRVTGAWVETTESQIDVRPLLKTTDSTIFRAFGSPSGQTALEEMESARNPMEDFRGDMKLEPARAKSALEDILREARAQPDAPYGETTMQSLEDIVHPNMDSIPNDYKDDENLDNGPALTQSEKDRRQEDLAMEAMSKHLQKARTSIKDVDRGLRRVENQIESSELAHPDPLLPSTTQPTSVKHVKLLHDGRTQCEHCGGMYTSAWAGLWTEFREIFYTYDSSCRWTFGIRPTYFTKVLFVWSIWLLLESITCYYTCHSRWKRGFSMDYEAPDFPFALSTLVFRPIKPVWLPLMKVWYWLTDIWLNLLWGEPEKGAFPAGNARMGWDGVMRPLVRPGQRTHLWQNSPNPIKTTGFRKTAAFSQAAFSQTLSKAATATAKNFARSFVDAVDEVGSMWDDEALG